MAELCEEFYHGWVIQVAQEQGRYTFRCCIQAQQISVTDTQNYSTFEHALRAGQLRADLESVRLALTTFLRGKRHFLLLHSEEQNALERSIAQYIEATKHQFN